MEGQAPLQQQLWQARCEKLHALLLLFMTCHVVVCLERGRQADVGLLQKLRSLQPLQMSAHALQACRQAAAVAGHGALASSSGLNSSEGKPGQCVPVLLFASLCDIDQLELGTASASSTEPAEPAKAAEGAPLVPRKPAAGVVPGAHAVQTISRAVRGDPLGLGRLGAGAVPGSQLATSAGRPAGSEVKRKELAAAEVATEFERQLAAAWPFLSRQAAQAGPGDAHQNQQQQPVLCRLLATGPVVVLDQRLCRRRHALRAGLSHLLGSRQAAASVDMAGFGLAQLRVALQGARQQALAAVAPSVLTASAPAFTPRPILLRNPASAGGRPPVLLGRPPMGAGSAPPPPVGPPSALGSASQGLQGSMQPPPPPPLAVPLPGIQGSNRAAPPTSSATAPGSAGQGFQDDMAAPHGARPPPPGRPGPGPLSQGFQGSVPLPSIRSSLSATAALPAVNVWLAACETLASVMEAVLQPAQQQVKTVRLASMPEPPTGEQAPLQNPLPTAAVNELWLKISLWLVACADPAYLLSHTKSSRAAGIAKDTYLEKVPDLYPAAPHEEALRMALRQLWASARGPAAAEAAALIIKRLRVIWSRCAIRTYRRAASLPSKSLIAPLFAVQECEELWQAGRQQCEAVSLTGKPCVLPHHAAAPAGAQPSGGQLQQEASNHTSGHQWLLATVDGQAQLQVPDAFRVSAANELLRPGGRRVQEGSQAPQQQQGKRKQQQMPPRPLDMRVLLTLPVELAAHLLQGLTLGSTSSLEGTADVLRWKGGSGREALQPSLGAKGRGPGGLAAQGRQPTSRGQAGPRHSNKPARQGSEGVASGGRPIVMHEQQQRVSQRPVTLHLGAEYETLTGRRWLVPASFFTDQLLEDAGPRLHGRQHLRAHSGPRHEGTLQGREGRPGHQSQQKQLQRQAPAVLTVPRPQPQPKQEGPWQPDDAASRQLLRVGGGACGSLSMQRASQPSAELGQLKRILLVTPEAALPLALDPVLTFKAPSSADAVLDFTDLSASQMSLVLSDGPIPLPPASVVTLHLPLIYAVPADLNPAQALRADAQSNDGMTILNPACGALEPGSLLLPAFNMRQPS
eukprot:jgi/Astpho2/2971/Aster-x1106